MSPAESHPSAEALWAAIERFTGWLDRVGYESYDPYDLWGTRYGLFARRLYYGRNPLGYALVAPILAVETLCPRLRGLFVKKQRFATADAQLLLACLNLHHICPPSSSTHPLRAGERAGVRCSETAPWLSKARELAKDLLRSSIPGYSGHCWGYPFDWQNNRGLWLRNTPFITATPYCYDAFAKLSDATGEAAYLDVAESAARFVFADLHDTPTGPDASAGSYGPFDRTQVVNASAYRCFVLFDAARRFGVEGYEAKARRNLNFILQSQRPDGSWLYALHAPGEAFIDHFHTCFVLKNLHKIWLMHPEPAIRAALHQGWAYYRRELFDAADNPKAFAIEPRTQLVRLEMYNFAEAITLGALLKDEIPEAFALAQKLAARLVGQHQLPAGHFVTRVFRGGMRHKVPFLRWPQSQLFYALTNLLLRESGLGSEKLATGATTCGVGDSGCD